VGSTQGRPAIARSGSALLFAPPGRHASFGPTLPKHGCHLLQCTGLALRTAQATGPSFTPVPPPTPPACLLTRPHVLGYPFALPIATPRTPTASSKKSNDLAMFVEARLGKPSHLLEGDRLRQFIANNGKVLRFW
jgi:hypothetical protein